MSININNKESYIVHSGNWKVRIKIDKDIDFNLAVIEAATLAIEAIFGKKDWDEDCEIFTLSDDSGANYLDCDLEDSDTDIDPPVPEFGILIDVVPEKYKNRKDKRAALLTSAIFANAAQAENVKIAEEYEKEFSKEFKQLKRDGCRVFDKQKSKKKKKV